MQKFVLLTTLLLSPLVMAKEPIRSISSNGFDKQHKPEHVLDGSNKTRWANKGDSWLMFEFEQLTTLQHIDLTIFKGDERKQHFDLEVSRDGMQWQKVFSASTSGATKAKERYRFSPSQARYARVNAYGTDVSKSWSGFHQIQFNSEEQVEHQFDK
ncbi:hypothetical protein LO82_03605 [Vibrio vulnificus]|uniref:discoidin domain-containing protein n=1 Tax=Vibrio vulnificus TaxID=672 RepID=UPI0006AD4DBB|nr:discoidin domain-containing protein [Vibrio vulnificus]KOR99331.1 hypothetical protein LO82_03605 [Vibrio vulnificus]HDY8063641.1 discoidin domain-containing protein [Vibrio vulnificus]